MEKTDGSTHHALCTVSNCPPLPITFWQVALHENLYGSYIIKIELFHRIKLVPGENKICCILSFIRK